MLIWVALLLLYYVVIPHLSAIILWVYITYYTNTLTYTNTDLPTSPSFQWLNSGVLICNLLVCFGKSEKRKYMIEVQ